MMNRAEWKSSETVSPVGIPFNWNQNALRTHAVRQRLNIPAVHSAPSKKRLMPFLKAKQQYAKVQVVPGKPPDFYVSYEAINRS